MSLYLGYGSDSLELVSCKITHKMLDFGKAEVRLADTSRVFQYGEYVSLSDSDKRVIFCGYVECVQNNGTLNLKAAPHDVEQKLEEAQKTLGVNPISKLQKNPPVTWSAVDNIARDFFQTSGVFEMNHQNVLDMKPLEINIQKNYVFDLTVRWNTYVNEDLDMGYKIFDGGLSTFTVDAIRNDWPAPNSQVGNFYVKESSLEVSDTEWVDLGDDRVQKHNLSGSLFLQRLVEQSTDETWEIKLQQNSEVTKRVPLYLDLSKYIENHPKWLKDAFYRQGDKVMHHQELKLLKAKRDHRSEEYDENDWELLEDEFLYENEDFVIESKLGDHVSKEILRTVSLYLFNQDPEITLEFTGEWSYWQGIDINDVVRAEIDGHIYSLRISDYTKIFQYGKKMVKVKCCGYRRAFKNGEMTLAIKDKIREEMSPTMYRDHHISVQNAAQAQMESYPKIKPTRIDYRFPPGNAYRKTKATINVDWNLV